METDFVHTVKFFDEHSKEIPVMEGLPKEAKYERYRIKNAMCFHARIDNKNIMLFQCIEMGDIAIWVSDYLIYTSVFIHCIIESESLEIHIM